MSGEKSTIGGVKIDRQIQVGRIDHTTKLRFCNDKNLSCLGRQKRALSWRSRRDLFAFIRASKKYDLTPTPIRVRSQGHGFSHGLKTCHRHVFLTAFQIHPSSSKRKTHPDGWVFFLAEQEGFDCIFAHSWAKIMVATSF